MKLLKIAALALCLNVTSIRAMTIEEACCGLCPFFFGMGPICIKEGFHNLQKATNVEKAREARETISSMEEGEQTADAHERLPHGAWFPETYPPARRKKGYAYIAVGTAMSMSALYTTGSLVCATQANHNQ